LTQLAHLPDAAFVTASHPGVLVLEATHRLERLPGVRRGAMAAVFPTLRHRGERQDPFALLLDVGATVDCQGDELAVFAAMGAAYARQISANERPRVALLSVEGSVESSPLAVRQAHQQLSHVEVPFEYIGCIGADQLTLGDADVVVTSGFAGGVVIRTLEGVVATAQELLLRASERFRWRLGVSMLGSGLERLRELTNWESYGGAPLLGFRQPVIVTQANSKRGAILNAIRLAAKVVRGEVWRQVGDSVQVLLSQGVGRDEG
jgi:glycerol-3-phosphate acyltransferase PlsX